MRKENDEIVSMSMQKQIFGKHLTSIFWNCLWDCLKNTEALW